MPIMNVHTGQRQRNRVALHRLRAFGIQMEIFSFIKLTHSFIAAETIRCKHSIASSVLSISFGHRNRYTADIYLIITIYGLISYFQLCTIDR